MIEKSDDKKAVDSTLETIATGKLTEEIAEELKKEDPDETSAAKLLRNNEEKEE